MHTNIIPATTPLHSQITVSGAELQPSTIYLLSVPLSSATKEEPFSLKIHLQTEFASTAKLDGRDASQVQTCLLRPSHCSLSLQVRHLHSRRRTLSGSCRLHRMLLC
jgi:hypothetical protein